MTQKQNQDLESIRTKLKKLLVENLAFLEEMNPEEIKDDEVLFGEGLGLDSLDAVEIVVILQRHFGLEVREMKDGKEIFYSIDTLSHFIQQKLSEQNS